jgi:hypothetical protein
LFAISLVLACVTSAFGQTTVLTSPGDGSRPTPDPVTAQILDTLSRPTFAEIEANDIKVPNGEVTQCEEYKNGNHAESTCAPHTRFEEIHQLILHFSLNGQSIKVIAGCSSYANGRDCHTFGDLGDPFTITCGPAADPKVQVCTTKGSRTFQIEANKKKHNWFVYPVEGGKPNRRYKIPLASVNDKTVIMGD